MLLQYPLYTYQFSHIFGRQGEVKHLSILFNQTGGTSE